DVASFLLNEKRSEIQKLESRLKVNIVLVPNSHIETPHYKVQRFKHDELNEMEHGPASYELVQMPEDAAAKEGEADAKKERQEAVVKGIVPVQPAPVVPDRQPEARPVQPREPAPVQQPPALTPAAAAAPQGGFLTTLLRWAGATAATP